MVAVRGFGNVRCCVIGSGSGLTVEAGVVTWRVETGIGRLGRKFLCF